MESSTLTDNQLNSLSICILDHYKDGESAFNENIEKQSANHYNNKRYVKEALIDFFINKPKKHKINKYIDSLICVFKELDQEEMTKVREKNNELIIRNKFLEKQNVLIKEGQTDNLCGSCYLNIFEYKKNFKQEFVSNYICEKEDVNRLNEKIKYLDEENRSLAHRNLTQSERLNNYSENYKQVPKDEYYNLINSKSQDLLDNSSNKCKKCKKYKKEIKKLKKKIESSSSSESDSD